MTEFISVDEKKKETKTVLTHYFKRTMGWDEARSTVENFDKVIHLGTCDVDGDMFACYRDNCIEIYKGTKGTEFN